MIYECLLFIILKTPDDWDSRVFLHYRVLSQLQNIFQNFQQQGFGIIFVHKCKNGMTWRTAETCVAKYNWWWVYYQNIVTYLPKCVLEDLLLYYIVLIHCSNPLQLVDCVEWGLLYTDLWFPLQLAVHRHTAGAAGAGVYGYILLYDCATFRGPCCLPMWVM